MKHLTETERDAIELAALIAKSAQSDIMADAKLLRLKNTALRHTIERLISIQTLLNSVVLS